MKHMRYLVWGAIAVLALSGCKVPTPTVSTVNIYDLNAGYKISGRDTIKNEDVDLCFKGSSYGYGRGNTYFYGSFSISDADIVLIDHTDGGSYRLVTDGEIEEGSTYFFSGINDNIVVDSISESRSISDCEGYGRLAGSLHLGSKPAQ